MHLLVLVYLLMAVCVMKSLANAIHICKQPIGPELCRYLCRHLHQCSFMDYQHETLRCHVTTDTSQEEADLDPVNVKTTVPVLETTLATCDPHSRIISTWQKTSVCLVNTEVHITKFKLEEKRKYYYLGDFEINVIGRTHLRMRIRAAGVIRIALLHGAGKYNFAISLGHLYKDSMYECGEECVRVQQVHVQDRLWSGSCCGFTDLWLQWSSVGWVSLGKGWIIGANIFMTYKRDAKVTFNDISLENGSNETVYVEVVQENGLDVNDMCSENRSDNSAIQTRIPLTVKNDVLNMNDYSIPIIGKGSLIIKIDNPGKFLLVFSDKYQFSPKTLRMITYSVKRDGSYKVWLTYCIGDDWHHLDPECDIDLKLLEIDSKDDARRLLTIWLQWKAGEYLVLGTGVIPGQNELIAYRDVHDAPPINYILIALLDGDLININVSGCI